MIYTKQPKTFHFKCSPGFQSDDKVLKNTRHLLGKEMVFLEKMDGENTSLYRHYRHARSIDSKHNHTQDWITRMHSIIANDIPEGYRFVFENVAYYHSIHYKDLEGFAYLLKIWDEKNYSLHYDEENEYANILDLPRPKCLYRGPYSDDIVEELARSIDTNTMEGFVACAVEPFHVSEYAQNTAKYVREGHIQPNHDGEIKHWLKNTFPNEVKDVNLIRPAFMRSGYDFNL